MTFNLGLRASRPWRLSIFAKLSFLIGAAVVTTALAVNEVYVRGANQILIERSIKDLEQSADYFRYPLDGVIGELKDDAQLLAHLSATQGLMRARLNKGV